MVRIIFAILSATLCFFVVPSQGADVKLITVASTTSTEQSGLFAHVLPLFQAQTGIRVKVVAVGTGQALDIGRRGDADVVLVHDRPAEDSFVAQGYGIERRDVMYNDFVIVGPSSDPANVRSTTDVVQALRRIAGSAVPFISRGDNSGTHATELRLWQSASLSSQQRGLYRESGSGMGPTLNMAASLNAYTLTDRGTWLSFRNRQQLAVLAAGDARLANPYGVMLVNPARHPHVNAAGGIAFINWLVSGAGREAIVSFRINGEQLFFTAN